MIDRKPPIFTKPVTIWRLDMERHSATWNTGEGAFRVGGRWNSVGIRAVYCSLDAATAILEVAVHKGFNALDSVPHTLTKAEIVDFSNIHVVQPKDVPNPHWLHPCVPSSGQQAFGNKLLHDYRYSLVPSVVSAHSWNLIFNPLTAIGFVDHIEQERYSLDTRLNLP